MSQYFIATLLSMYVYMTINHGLEMSRIYVYKMTTDNGGAPCIWHNLLSLAICKPAIRRTANGGDLIFGFGGKKQGYEERIIYIARVRDALSGYEYYVKYSSRPDAIYQWRGGRFEWKKGSNYHIEGEFDADVGTPENGFRNARVLICKEFCYFGSNADVTYKLDFPILAEFVSNEVHRGHRVNFRETVRAELLAIADKYLERNKGRKLAEPIESTGQGAC